MQLTVILSSLCKYNAKIFFAVKRYAVREAKNDGTQYARLKKRYAVYNGEGVSPSMM